MKFFLDQNISPKVTQALRDSGHDAIDTRDVSMQTASDEKLWQLAKRQNRTFVTFDLDFADLRRYTPNSKGAVIVFRTKSTTSKTVIGLLETLLNLHSEAELKGKLVIVTESQFRIRKN